MSGSHVRFSIAGLMGLVVVVGVAVAAVRSASDAWADAVFTAALGFVAIALLGAAFRRGTRRAFWAGAALFGAGYLSLCFGPWSAEQVRPHLISTLLLDSAYGCLHPRVGSLKIGALRHASQDSIIVWNRTEPALTIQGNPFLSLPLIRPPTPEAFQRVGHSLLAMGLAIVGGLIARRFADDRTSGPGAS